MVCKFAQLDHLVLDVYKSNNGPLALSAPTAVEVAECTIKTVMAMTSRLFQWSIKELRN